MPHYETDPEISGQLDDGHAEAVEINAWLAHFYDDGENTSLLGPDPEPQQPVVPEEHWGGL